MRQKLDAVRAELEAGQDRIIPAGFPPGLPPGAEPPGIPEPLLAVLRASNGPWAFTFLVHPADEVAGGQAVLDLATGYEEITSDPDRWLAIGSVEDEPLLMDRRTGEVWWFPDTGTPWYMSDEFEVLAADPLELVDDYLLGDRYLEVATDEEWFEVLRRAGLVTGDA